MINPELLESAYRKGIFPMAGERGKISWYSPDPRAIIPLDGFHLPDRLKRTIRAERLELVVDRDFEGTLRACAGRNETWINEEIIASYTALHKLGKAHSVEAWHERTLAGGLYGVSLGGAFMGESMFTQVRDASKVCLAFLVNRLRERGYLLLDTQFITPHLKKFGAIEIPRKEYLTRLEEALKQTCTFS